MPIIVNGTEIPNTAVDQEVQYHPAPTLDAAREEAARALVVRQLLLDEARKLGHTGESTAGDETREDAAIRELLDSEIRIPDADEETCRRYYENNKATFRSPDIFEAAHILFPASPDDEDARKAAKQQALDTIQDLVEQPERFAELARERSACPSKAQGGSLGQITRGQTVPEFETFLYHLLPGTLCPVPVPTPFGFHVLRLDRRIDGRELPFEMVRERIAVYLHDASWRRALHQYIQLLAGQGEVTGVALPAAASPLVQ
ncbi:MAG TPA: peptidylprolyl isomerase [Azospirillum sp.]|nr:peptidylprolyl isomerase [Azospirillum sp.]